MKQKDGRNRYEYLTQTPVPKLISRLAVPTILSMLVTGIYNTADTFFVGRISTQATAAVGLVFSVMAVIQAIGFFCGQGSGTFISRMLGAGRRKEAEEMANITVNEEETMKLLSQLFPINDNDTDRAKKNMEQAKQDFIVCYNMPDIAKFYGTKWGLVNAAADFVDHRTPARLTKNYAENNFGRILDGSTILDTVMASVTDSGIVVPA